jgi:hypothetical protein
VGLGRQRGVDLTGAAATLLPQPVDGPALGDGGQPGDERAARIEGRACPVQGDQHVLHHIVEDVGVGTLRTGNTPNHRHALAQHDLVGRAVAALGRCHRGRQAPIGRGALGGKFRAVVGGRHTFGIPERCASLARLQVGQNPLDCVRPDESRAGVSKRIAVLWPSRPPVGDCQAPKVAVRLLFAIA